MKTTPTPSLLQVAYNLPMEIDDWYLTTEFSYLRIYGHLKTPHNFPLYITDKMIFLQISYQTYINGVAHTFSFNRKYMWPHSLQVNKYYIEHSIEA